MLIPYQLCSNVIRELHGIIPKKVVHIGAHMGEEAESYKNNGVEEVIWFEANRSLLRDLEDNLKKYRIRQKIIPVALWDENKELDFKITNNLQSSSFLDLGTHSHHYPEVVVEKSEKVLAYRLDSIVTSMPELFPFTDFDFVNIDTQGAELNILRGMGVYVFQDSVKGVYVEVNVEEVYKGAPTISQIDKFLMQGGFFRMKTRITTKGWGDALYVRQALI